MKLLVIDGNSIVNRAYYGIRPLTTKTGMYTNGIYGFLTILERLKEESKPDGIAIAFDLKAPTFRHKMYDGYKAKRTGMPDELAMQMPVLKELLEYLGHTNISVEGFEADDIIGTLGRLCEESGNDCIIATGDRDSLQLVSSKTAVRLATTKFGQSTVTIYDEAKILEDYGVKPKQLIDIKAIQGDTSDNIPGVAGIGEKGAKDLIGRFSTLEYIYENIDTIDIKKGIREKLIASKDNALLSYELGKINTYAPIDTNLENYLNREGDPQKALSLMAELELFKLIEKLNVKEAVVEEEKEECILKTMTASAVMPLLQDLGEAYFTVSGENIYFSTEKEVIKAEITDSFLKSFAKNAKIKKNCDNLKLFAKMVKERTNEDIQAVVMDTSIAAYLLNPSATGYELDRLCTEYSIPLGENEDGIASLCHALPKLCKLLAGKIKEYGQEFLFNEVEIPLAIVLADMELVGVKLDTDGIKIFGEKLKSEILELDKTVKQEVGYEFNLNSPKQLGEALFEKLELPHGKKTKTGYSTNAQVLESLRHYHPVVEKILEYRTLTKLNSTYCEGLLKVVAEDGRIHSNFNQTETRTGRISSTEPNLQNIPVRTTLGSELRKFFVAKENCVYVDADYSQIELRVLAHVANDEVMIKAFNENKDIHTQTAARVFGMPETLVTPKMRSSAKAVNFGIVYGIGAFSLSQDIGVTRKEAENYINEYLKNFCGVRDYMDEVIAQAKEKGYSEDIFARRRYLPELTSSNFNMRAFGERVARNMPIQGAAADIIKIAMVKVYNRLKAENLQSKLILQVHDELIVEASEDEAEKVRQILTEEMQEAYKMQVPLLADAKIGKTWYDSKG